MLLPMMKDQTSELRALRELSHISEPKSAISQLVTTMNPLPPIIKPPTTPTANHFPKMYNIVYWYRVMVESAHIGEREVHWALALCKATPLAPLKGSW